MVLFLILRQARLSKDRHITFPSLSAMLRLLGRPVRLRNRQRLMAALMLWWNLSLRWHDWFCPASYKRRESKFNDQGQHVLAPKVKVRDAEHVTKLLPPPINRLRFQPLRITVAEAWYEISKYEARVDLPLPLRAATQNLVLALIANPHAKRTSRSWCRSIGLNHGTRNGQLDKIMWTMASWFERHHDELVQPLQRDGGLRFVRMKRTELPEEAAGSLTHDLGGVHNS
jgi:hypothetical protein